VTSDHRVAVTGETLKSQIAVLTLNILSLQVSLATNWFGLHPTQLLHLGINLNGTATRISKGFPASGNTALGEPARQPRLRAVGVERIICQLPMS